MRNQITRKTLGRWMVGSLGLVCALGLGEAVQAAETIQLRLDGGIRVCRRVGQKPLCLVALELATNRKIVLEEQPGETNRLVGNWRESILDPKSGKVRAVVNVRVEHVLETPEGGVPARYYIQAKIRSTAGGATSGMSFSTSSLEEFLPVSLSGNIERVLDGSTLEPTLFVGPPMEFEPIPLPIPSPTPIPSPGLN